MENQNCRIGKVHKGVKLTIECLNYPPLREYVFGTKIAWEETCPNCLEPWWMHDKNKRISREYLEQMKTVLTKAFDLQYPKCAVKNYQQ